MTNFQPHLYHQKCNKFRLWIARFVGFRGVPRFRCIHNDPALNTRTYECEICKTRIHADLDWIDETVASARQGPEWYDRKANV